MKYGYYRQGDWKIALKYRSTRTKSSYRYPAECKESMYTESTGNALVEYKGKETLLGFDNIPGIQRQETRDIIRHLKHFFDGGRYVTGKGHEKRWKIVNLNYYPLNGPWENFPSQVTFPWSYFDFNEVNGKAVLQEGDDRAWALVEQFAPILEMYFGAEKISDVLNTVYHGARTVVKISENLRVTKSTLSEDAVLGDYNPQTTFICQTSGSDTLIVFPDEVSGLDESLAYRLLGKLFVLQGDIYFPSPSSEIIMKMGLSGNWRREFTLLAFAGGCQRNREILLQVFDEDVLLRIRKGWLQMMKQNSADPHMIALANRKWK